VTDEQQDKQQDDDALETSGFGARIRVPNVWAPSVGPLLKWLFIGAFLSMIILSTFLGLSWVLK